MLIGLKKKTAAETKTFLLFTIIVAVYGLQIYYTNNFLITENILRINYQFLDNEVANRIITSRLKYSFWSYIILPFIIILRCLIFCIPVYIKGILETEWEIKFKQLFKIALYGETIFLFYGALKIIILTINNDPLEIANLGTFSPISLLSVSDYFNVNTFPFTYIFQIINLFEVFFWVFIIASISNFIGVSFKKSFIHVLLSYGIALLIWVLFIIFIQLQFI